MPALLLLQPGWLTAAVVLATFVALTARSTRRGRPALLALGAGALGAASAGLLASVLALQAPPLGPLLLLLLGGLAGLLLVRELYRRETRMPTRGPAALRWLAWCCAVVLVARPVCERTGVDWERPLLAVLLDNSRSMEIVDPGVESAGSRAARVNRALAAAQPLVARIGELFDLELRAVGERAAPRAAWQVTPGAPLTGIARALRTATELRSSRGEPPMAVVLVSDGAENVEEQAAVGQAALDLARQRTALWVVGVGPAPGRAASVELEPLAVPPRVNLRDQVPVPVTGRASGCAGAQLGVEVLWDGVPVAATAVAIAQDDAPFAARLSVEPPAVGPHRLTVRAHLPSQPGDYVQAERIVDVRVERVSVLWLEQTPRPEAAFALRALRTDARLEVTPRFVLDAPTSAWAAPQAWSGFDVVVLGRLALPPAAAEELARGVMHRGIGLLIAPGHADVLLRPGPLAELLPATVSEAEAAPMRFAPTPAGLRHPVLSGVGVPGPDATTTSPAASSAATAPAVEPWAALPTIAGGLRLSAPKPAATVLAADRSPLLIAQEVGRGRVLLAAWESTWRWALASEHGGSVHGQLWQQMCAWLANRRRQAWVLTDRGEYSRAVLRGRDDGLEIRGGLTDPGLAPAPAPGATMPAGRADAAPTDWAPEFVLRRDGAPGWELRLPGQESAPGWTATWPTTGPGQLEPGRYEVTLTFPPDAPDEIAELTARTQFTLLDEDLEHRPPTDNLPLLRAAARQAAAAGGGYVPLEELPAVLARLAETDHRTRIERRARLDLVGEAPALLLGILLACLSAEWFWRKRCGRV